MFFVIFFFKHMKGVQNLFDRLDRMAAYEPAWVDVTWGAGGTTAQKTIEICATAQKYCGLETMMHLTCTNMPRDQIEEALRLAKEAGIQNILALRGGLCSAPLRPWPICSFSHNYWCAFCSLQLDPPRGEEWKKGWLLQFSICCLLMNILH